MSSSAHYLLSQYINERLPFYLQHWQHFTLQLQSVPSQPIFPLLQQQMQHFGLQTTVLAPQFIYGGHTKKMTQTAHTLLLVFTLPPESTLVLQQEWLKPLFDSLYACEIYQATYGHVPFSLKWLVHLKGENDHSTFKQIITEQSSLLQAGGCLWYESQPYEMYSGVRLALGSKGHLRIQLEVQSARQPIHSAYGAIAPNAAWQLLWALNSIKDAHEDIHIRGFYDAIKPLDDAAFEMLTQLPDETKDYLQRWGIEQLLLGMQGQQQLYAHYLTPTCSVNFMQSPSTGTRDAHMMPIDAQAQLDFHLVPDQDPGDIFTSLQHHLEEHSPISIQTQLISASAPIYSSLQDPFIQRVKAAMKLAHEYQLHLVPLTTTHLSPALLSHQYNTPIAILPTNLMMSKNILTAEVFIRDIRQNAFIFWQLAQH